jgi:hypothetical protein
VEHGQQNRQGNGDYEHKYAYSGAKNRDDSVNMYATWQGNTEQPIKKKIIVKV